MLQSQLLVSTTQWPPCLCGAARANHRSCNSIRSPHILRPGRIICRRFISIFSGVSQLCTANPCPLLSMFGVTIHPSLFSIESQMPPHAKNTQYFSIPYLHPCLRCSLGPRLKSCPRPTFRPHSQPYHLVLSPSLGSMEGISIDPKMNQARSPHLQSNTWRGTCCGSSRNVCGAYPLWSKDPRRTFVLPLSTLLTNSAGPRRPRFQSPSFPETMRSAVSFAKL